MIQLDNVKPIPIYQSQPNKASQTWASQCTFERGKKYLVTAPSGKGKSTLLHILYGLRNDYDGDCKIEDQVIRNFSMDEWAAYRQSKLSIVFQDLRLFLKLTALENILLKTALTQHKTEATIKEMAQEMGVAELLSKKCETLSYGQRQRIALIRSLCQPFHLLLLDEPFSHLDKENIAIATKMIKRELEAQKAGLVLVSLGEPYDFDYDHHYLL